jgi:hypothetical protein
MAIVETIVLTRPNTAVDFYSDTESSFLIDWRASMQSLRDSGKFTTVKTLSDDELVQTIVSTFTDFATWAEVLNSYSVAYDYNRSQYASVNGIKANKTITGLDAAFTKTVVYMFPDGMSVNNPLTSSHSAIYTSPYGNTINLSDMIEIFGMMNTGVLQSLTSSDTTVTAVFACEAGAGNKWSDWGFLDALVALGVTRTVACVLV